MRVGPRSIAPFRPPTSRAPAAPATEIPIAVSVPKPATSPRSLEGAARAAHVKAAILEYEKPVLDANPKAGAAKLEKLKSSAFTFFRGTADLFYRDLAGLDADRPIVLAYGDVHPENVGVMARPDGHFAYALDDWDEAYAAPFSWDLRRGATAFDLVGRQAGLDAKGRAKLVRGFLEGYAAAFGGEKIAAPSFVNALVEAAEDTSRKKYLKRYAEDGVFIESSELRRRPKLAKEADKALAAYRKSLPAAPKKAFFAVKDVAEKTGSGTGSIGLRRLYVLIEGEEDKNKDDLILELKARRPSVLARHLALPAHQARAIMDRIDRMVLEQWAKVDRFSGVLSLDGEEFKVRERHPAHDRVDLADLDAKQHAAYARFIGGLIAEAHRSAKLGASAIALDAAFLEEIAAFGAEQGARVVEDHAAFAKG